MTKQKKDVWLITGCSTGFGRELSKLVLARGGKVSVTARDPKKIQDIVAGHGERALALKLDVTDDRQIAEAVRKTEETFGGIDVLVNNAGFGYLSAVEEGEEKEVRAMFETNFFGLCKMTQAVLPGMRRKRSGHIVNISSIGGLVGFAGVGYYNATKFAVEGISEALAQEVEPLGIKVMVVEPSGFRTDWAGRSLKQCKKEIEDYAKTARVGRHQIASNSGHQNGDPVRAAQAIIQAVESLNPPFHLLLGCMAFEAAMEKLDEVRSDAEAWKKVTIGADAPAV